MGSSPIRVPFFSSLKKLHTKYYFLYFAVLLAFFGCLQQISVCKSFSFSFFDSYYEIKFWKIYTGFILLSLLNGFLYLIGFYFKKIAFYKWYQIHFFVFIFCAIILFGSLSLTTCFHFFRKYYAYNEFYKLQLVIFFDISISLALFLIIVIQLLLPVNFIWSLLNRRSIT
jgi:heme/copper-type cytochrome/quinol oxidase subunit 1